MKKSNKKSNKHRAGEGINEPLSDILYNMLSDELFKHPGSFLSLDSGQTASKQLKKLH